MSAICFYFQVHQPYRLRHYTFFDIGANSWYEDENANCGIMLKVARKCYLPMNDLLLKLIRRHEGLFKVSFSISGTALDQFETYAPEVIQSYRELVSTGCVELLSETYNHSLSFLYSPDEFKEQVRLHDDRIEELFGVRPTSFRNTELIYNNALARTIEEMGYKAILAEGADHVLGWRSPNFVYRPAGCERLCLLLKNYRLSDDIAFRFSNHEWPEFPLTADKFAQWAQASGAAGDIINLFMDYETFGEHQWESTGIFQFMEALPQVLLSLPDFSFVTPTEAAERFHPVAKLDVHNFMSWADAERDLTAWLGNDMQQDAITAVYRLEEQVRASGSADLLRTWRRLQTSDHFYYMCTKWFADGDVHSYFNPYGTPYDAYINYMNVLADFGLTLESAHRA
ncbi:glycoside hydrolase family 57 protein [uncultured Desulfovibrio sp.]|uniref:glycoside hydrolase family 57 protein n=1 Tax=uncultured Desulfovibrio sp. TaxID=167968 RepID=UPI002613ADC6|nr:glycoside hydrolase family 57 protein [uncultured Desulfovibrio sp.]